MGAAPSLPPEPPPSVANDTRPLSKLLDLLTHVRVLPSSVRPEGPSPAHVPLDLRRATARRWHALRRGRPADAR